MPRVNKIEQSIVDLMDEYSVCLIEILRLPIDVFYEITALNRIIKDLLVQDGFDGDANTLDFEQARLCVIAFYISGGMDESHKTGINLKALWLSMSKLPEEFDSDTITRLINISLKLLKKNNLLSVLFELVTLDKIIRIINLIEKPFAPVLMLHSFCKEELFTTKWQLTEKFGDFEDVDIARFRAFVEKEFNNIVKFLEIASSNQYHVIDSNKNTLEINGEIHHDQIVLLIPHAHTSLDNSILKEKLEKYYHQLISWQFNSVKVCVLYDFKSTSKAIEFCSPDSGYERKIIMHKGSLIGLYGAIYTQLIYTVNNTKVKDALNKAQEGMSNLGFTCNKATIRKVRIQNLKIFKPSKNDSLN
jgi:hypothetical protein